MSIDPMPAATRWAIGLTLLLSLSATAQWGGVDSTFAPGGGNTGFDNDVFSVRPLPDGRLLVTGFFESIARTPRSGVARLNSNGTLDSTFNPGAGATTPGGLPHTIETHALLPDGRLIVGGRFQAFDGIAQPHLARLLPNGSFDDTFRPAVDGVVLAVALQIDQKLLLAGGFTSINGAPAVRLARLLENGSLDPAFQLNRGLDRSVAALALQPDGSILIGGAFTNYTGLFSPRIARIDATGYIDRTFQVGNGPDAPVTCLALQPDGKVLVGGGFTTFDGTPRVYLARLHPNGSLDASFTPDIALAFGGVLAVRVAPDGKVLVAGEFTTVDGQSRPNLARLHPDGRLDTSFNTGSGPTGGLNPRVRCLALQSDGKVLAGGGFTRFNGVDRDYLARLTADQGGSLRFTATNYSFGEDVIVAEITVERTGSTQGTAQLSYLAHGGTATPETDYLPQIGSLTFAPGETLQTFTVPIRADAETEADEYIRLLIGNPIGGYVLGDPLSSWITILDRPLPNPTLAITSVSLSVNAVSVAWAATPGRTYQLQYRTNLTSAPWTTLPGDVTATGPTASKTDSALREPERHYRVRQLP